jgi:hypothetical protein
VKGLPNSRKEWTQVYVTLYNPKTSATYKQKKQQLLVVSTPTQAKHLCLCCSWSAAKLAQQMPKQSTQLARETFPKNWSISLPQKTQFAM